MFFVSREMDEIAEGGAAPAMSWFVTSTYTLAKNPIEDGYIYFKPN